MAPPLTDAQLREELRRCRSCEAKPCRGGCPAGLSPGDFILAVRCGEPSDFRRAAAHVLSQNPLGGVCGSVCPDTLCMARCVRAGFDRPVNIPAIQAAIVARARRLGVLPRFEPLPSTGHRVAVVGAGPAGLGAASVLAKAGHAVRVFDRARRAGGMARLIPGHRLDPDVLEGDLAWLLGLGELQLSLGRPVPLPRELLARGYAAVVVAAGLGEPISLDVPGGERALPWTALLGERPPALAGRRVAVIGDGPVAVDCALAAQARGAAHVELLALRRPSELALARAERDRLFESGVHVSGRVRVAAIRGRGGRVSAVVLHRVELPAGEAYHPSRLVDLKHGEHERRDLDVVVAALGGRPGLRREPHPRVVYAGDLEAGPTTVVGALASGKRAAQEVHRMLAGADAACPDRASCADGSGCPKRATCPEWSRPASTSASTPAGAASGPARAGAGLPVALEVELVGRRVASPFLLAAGPPTAGATRLRRAYQAGWAGAVLAVPAACPEEALEAACRDVERIVREFPDRLTLVQLDPAPGAASAAAAAAIRRLEATGAVGIGRVERGAAVSGVDPADYLAAASLLAGGAPFVLVSSAVVRHGLGIVNELQAGLSWLLAERRLASVAALVGSEAARAAAPAGGSIAPSPGRALSTLAPALCTGCGDCSRCDDQAIALDLRGRPVVDPARCTGCGACVSACFTGALSLQPRAAA